MPHFRLDISYDGTDFRGYAKQPETRTVQGELEKVLAQVGGSAESVVAGRTDAGVHARAQVVSATIRRELKEERLHNALNRMLPDDIGIGAVAEVDESFNARYDATSRTYRYFVLQKEYHDPFRRQTHWQLDESLNLEAMNDGAGHLLGEHDFASFCRRAEGRSTTRTILRAEWAQETSDTAMFEVQADAFCHKMVRSIVAVLVNVGIGAIAPEAVRSILETRDRRVGRGTAPPQGLYLWSVEYG